MKLNIFDKPEPSINNNISISVHSITFTKYLNNLLSIEGKRVIIAQDSDKPKDWYFKVGTTGYLVERGADGVCRIKATNAARAIFQSLGLPDTHRIKCLVSLEANEAGFYPIITNSAKTQKS
jgi:hypothetical protein